MHASLQTKNQTKSKQFEIENSKIFQNQNTHSRKYILYKNCLSHLLFYRVKKYSTNLRAFLPGWIIVIANWECQQPAFRPSVYLIHNLELLLKNLMKFHFSFVQKHKYTKCLTFNFSSLVQPTFFLVLYNLYLWHLSSIYY